MFNKKKWHILLGIMLMIFLLVQVGRLFFREQEREIRHSIYTAVKRAYPKAAQRFMQSHGLKLFKTNLNLSPGEAHGTVILIHGLDEPGLIWMNLAPVLSERGFKVLIMTYPNDQPIKASSTFFFSQMASYFTGEKKSVSIVAHSMGGLIARDMLTDPLFDYSKKATQGKVPPIEHFIMVGTPNNGAPLAQFRFFIEIRDQFHNLFDKETHWLNSLLDGAGEAGLDLLPGSPFLIQLNSRPLPDPLDIQVIAGTVNPWADGEIPAFIQHLEQNLPRQTRPASRALEKTLVSMSRTIGDGLVSVNSAQLNKVPLTMVQGTHLTMIRNISVSSQRIPPAVPLILKMLTP
jgi:pimeloyl-ACP methyl ester carboxylesterase